ncbi:FMN-dependent NADH-azoreductase [Litorimonas taeanensis]|uniref:FMN dependent NADH:quinone oxidoreductase n=1 Tax=Litorimonas taeanensis TaxID=568099 RepID=A0A420WEK2_9PROT|nr:NAD(P)H-dependent oxidoreductase [Litorimonas taeanensis]RKQ69350.1 FMN-dependent NADH-azoreductase [Litorimonas taeanensis]
MKDINTILRLDVSPRKTDSISRRLTQKAIDSMSAKGPVKIINRDLSEGLNFVNEGWIGANFTPAEARDEAQHQALIESDTLVSELEQADTLLIGTPIYNFSIPASLKSWIDMVARVGKTFAYTETGPQGLLKNKRAIVLVASGGTQLGSEIDFATPYLRHALGFIGISDVTFIAADALAQQAEAKIQLAFEAIESL